MGYIFIAEYDTNKIGRREEMKKEFSTFAVPTSETALINGLPHCGKQL